MSIESFVFNVAEKVLEKVASTAYDEICFAWGLEGELKKLEDILSTVKAVLLDAEEKQATNRELRVWLAKLKEALYDAEDVLDEFECETKRRQVLKLYGITTKKVGRFFSSSNPLAFRFKMGHKIKQVRGRIDEIASHRTKFHLNEQYESRQFVHRTREMTHSYVQASDIIGRDEDKEKIIELLTNPSDNRKLSVIPIIGIEIGGKTNLLTKLVYNDERVNRCFQLKIWICVSEDFDIKMLVEKIIQSATDSIKSISNLEMDPLQRMLQKTIGDKKYLLVLDDVWNDDPMKWNQLRELLLMGGKGSKILVTTRSDLVASVVGTIPSYELCGLPHDKCMALFLKFAFKEGQKKHYANLLKIGDEIVKKCKGVPLAVKTLASLLFMRTDEDYWKFVRNNELWKLEQKENEILPALRLSYEQLPSHLKRCFAYCSFFPKDHSFESLALVQFWMAYGLIQSSNENEELEDIGFHYIQELASRSFFQDIEYEFGGILVVFKMHDLMHDLALSLMQNECVGFNFLLWA
ncbi:disease resistance protein RGA2 [Jatropha curcas]|uniref:disease resistance protein RGA2 n=1 Tax=Jatropha curcas TaxID=180498 RepID=UPI00189328D6|nr:disease resistance protein RGA2 [Jatropha curcas]